MTQILPQISSRIAKKSGTKAKVSLQRIYANWTDIIGSEYAHKAIPIKITWNKQKDKKDKAEKLVATLHILSASAIATSIMYQEKLIIERLSRTLGYSAIQNIKIQHENGLDIRLKKGLFTPKLKAKDKSYLNDVLDSIEDRGIREALAQLGEKILLDKQR